MTTIKGKSLPPDVFEAFVTALAEALVLDYRRRWSESDTSASVATLSPSTGSSPWLTVREAAARARCGVKLLYREVIADRLRAVRVGGRRSMRFRGEWIDEWLQEASRR